MGDLDLGYELRANSFGLGTFLIADHAQQDLLTGQAPAANVYSSGFHPYPKSQSKQNGRALAFSYGFGRGST